MTSSSTSAFALGSASARSAADSVPAYGLVLELALEPVPAAEPAVEPGVVLAAALAAVAASWHAIDPSQVPVDYSVFPFLEAVVLAERTVAGDCFETLVKLASAASDSGACLADPAEQLMQISSLLLPWLLVEELVFAGALISDSVSVSEVVKFAVCVWY